MAPNYLMPRYINLDMMTNQLSKTELYITDNPELGASGIYIDVANDLLAKAESYVIKNILSNYVQIPLETIYNTPFDNLYGDNKYHDTYVEIRDLFLNSAFWQIYKSYYSFNGSNNGDDIIKQYQDKLNAYINMLQRLDQAGNPLIKNAFAGLKLGVNSSQRIANVARVPLGIPQGTDQSYSVFNSIPNLRWGFNK